jgi:hypothetical protein
MIDCSSTAPPSTGAWTLLPSAKALITVVSSQYELHVQVLPKLNSQIYQSPWKSLLFLHSQCWRQVVVTELPLLLQKCWFDDEANVLVGIATILQGMVDMGTVNIMDLINILQ